MTSPVPSAPEGYEEPIWRHDTIDVLVVMDRSEILQDPESLDHPIDRLAVEVANVLPVLMNVAAHVLTTEEIRYDEDIPTQIYGVVTNSTTWADWGRSWGGSVIEVAVIGGEVLEIRFQDGVRTFASNDITSAAEFIGEAVQQAPDPAVGSVTPTSLQAEGSIGDLVPGLTVNAGFDAAGDAIVGATVEPLMGLVRALLDEGAWSVDRGYDFGVEEEVERDLAELERQLRPISGRPANPVMVQSYVALLGQAALEHARRLADDAARDRVDHLRSQVMERVSRVDGSEQDLVEAAEALDILAFSSLWTKQATPSDVADDEWEQFVDEAKASPARIAAMTVGWLPKGRGEAAASVLGGATLAGGIGFFAQSVATWAGVGASTGAAVAIVGGIVGAVVGAILGVMAARFTPSEDREPTHRPES